MLQRGAYGTSIGVTHPLCCASACGRRLREPGLTILRASPACTVPQVCWSVIYMPKTMLDCIQTALAYQVNYCAITPTSLLA